MRYFSAARPLRPLAGLIALAIAATAAPTLAQRYESDAIESRLSNKGVIARRYAKTGQGDGAEFKEYIEKYFFPAMTQTTPEGLADLEKMQGDLFKSFLTGVPAATQRYMHEQALDFSTRVVANRKYHPSVRYNALLMLGRLNDKYPAGGEDPTPAAKGTDLLCSLTSASISSPRTPNYLLVGALLGLERHANYYQQLPRPQQAKLMRTLYDVLTVEKLEGEFTPEVREWIFTRTASAIASMKTPGPQGVFVKGLAKRVGDDTLSLEARATILRELAEMEAEAGQDYGAAIAKAAIELASDIGEEEAEIAEKFDDMQLQAGVGFVGARGKMSRRVTVTPENGPQLYREGILALFNDLQKGVAAAADISPEDQKPALTAINEAIKNVVNKTADKGTIDLDVTEAIKQMASTAQEATVQPLANAE
ncbi:hypothetical protein [Botrimarina mediterranea]|uniref:Uncharacterized protein n=1 Tax=Botrimarina mediterranea TaxID=2528022 RepID=A0A518K336_9BACT|nr:hypothetical protein [Botrimarina mediterranea]QDV72165.1 hypothetical protein Spa11_03370 [Botrimarina mediterranea]QDV76708.1 hypothetical protein K2D_02890 [Planctomycetes bacterium K2D]